MSCHLSGADELRVGLKQRFQGLKESDLKIGEVSCLGQCDGAPAISINDHIYRGVTPAQAEALVLTALGDSGLPHMPPEAQVNGLASDPYRDFERYGADATSPILPPSRQDVPQISTTCFRLAPTTQSWLRFFVYV
jgi:(2Fe-2S) ferredoxin